MVLLKVQTEMWSEKFKLRCLIFNVFLLNKILNVSVTQCNHFHIFLFYQVKVFNKTSNNNNNNKEFIPTKHYSFRVLFTTF